MYDLELGIFFVSRDAIFSEEQFPYVMDQLPISCDDSNQNNLAVSFSSQDMAATPTVDTVSDGRTINTDSTTTNTGTQQQTEQRSIDLTQQGDTASERETTNTDSTEPLGRGHRVKFSSTKLRDFVTNTIFQISPSTCSTTPSCSSGTPYPLANYVSCTKFSLQHRHFLAAITAGTKPRTFVEAVKDPRWRLAMQQEIQALENNGTWSMQSLPSGKRLSGANGSIESNIILMGLLNGSKLDS